MSGVCVCQLSEQYSLQPPRIANAAAHQAGFWVNRAPVASLQVV